MNLNDLKIGDMIFHQQATIYYSVYIVTKELYKSDNNHVVDVWVLDMHTKSHNFGIKEKQLHWTKVWKDEDYEIMTPDKFKTVLKDLFK